MIAVVPQLDPAIQCFQALEQLELVGKFAPHENQLHLSQQLGSVAKEPLHRSHEGLHAGQVPQRTGIDDTELPGITLIITIPLHGGKIRFIETVVDTDPRQVFDPQLNRALQYPAGTRFRGGDDSIRIHQDLALHPALHKQRDTVPAAVLPVGVTEIPFITEIEDQGDAGPAFQPAAKQQTRIGGCRGEDEIMGLVP